MLQPVLHFTTIHLPPRNRPGIQLVRFTNVGPTLFEGIICASADLVTHCLAPGSSSRDLQELDGRHVVCSNLPPSPAPHPAAPSAERLFQNPQFSMKGFRGFHVPVIAQWRRVPVQGHRARTREALRSFQGASTLRWYLRSRL